VLLVLATHSRRPPRRPNAICRAVRYEREVAAEGEVAVVGSSDIEAAEDGEVTAPANK
jgi:hypothetical protein